VGISRARSGLYASVSCHAAQFLFLSHPKWPLRRRFPITKLADRNATWKELTSVCCDMVGCIARNPRENAEWQMELMGDSRTPIFRIRPVAKTPNQNLGSGWP
jgi:hypothetical protein